MYLSKHLYYLIIFLITHWFIFDARNSQSITILLNCRLRKHMILAKCRWSLVNAECIPNNTNAYNAMYDKDAAIEGGYHMKMKEEKEEEKEERKAHAWYTHGRERRGRYVWCWLTMRENANVFGTMSKGAYNVEGGVARDRRTIRRATILRVYLRT